MRAGTLSGRLVMRLVMGFTLGGAVVIGRAGQTAMGGRADAG